MIAVLLMLQIDVSGLAAESVEERDKAQAALLALGGPALESLREARDGAKDPEVRARLKTIIEALEAKSLPWRSLVRSDLVVVGAPGYTARISKSRTEAVRAKIGTPLKGAAPDEPFTFMRTMDQGIPEPECLFGFVWVDDAKRWYLVDVRPADPWILEETKREIALHEKLLKEFAVKPERETDEVVAAAIERLAGEEAQAGADALTDLGDKALPSIIARLDDRRPMKDRGISFKNASPEAFEAVRHYSPKQVVDALSAVLNRITGEHFFGISNGAPDAQRDREIAAWRLYWMKH